MHTSVLPPFCQARDRNCIPTLAGCDTMPLFIGMGISASSMIVIYMVFILYIGTGNQVFQKTIGSTFHHGN